MMKSQPSVVSGVVLDETVEITLLELCQIGRVDAEQIIEMVEEGILEPLGQTPRDWRFNCMALKRMESALRLQRDLRVNLAGAALALDLLDELNGLRHR